MSYRLIIIEKSLDDRHVLNSYPVLSQTLFAAQDRQRASAMLKIVVQDAQVGKLAGEISTHLKEPYYAHMYHEDKNINTMFVIFRGRIFTVQKTQYDEARNYGLQHGVSKEEMKIEPVNITDESW